MTDEQKKRGPAATQISATGEAVRKNVTRLRKAHGWTTYELAQRMNAAGRPIPQSGVSRVESGGRRVDADDLAAFSIVFGVSPAALLLPLKDSPRDSVDVTGAGRVSAETAWEWASNRRPLKTPTSEAHTAQLKYVLNSLPPNARQARQHPAGRAIEAAHDDVTRLIVRAGWTVEGTDQEFYDLLDQARTSLDRARSEVDRIGVEQAELIRFRDGAGAKVREGGTDGPSVD
ncbi:helix-turn-helix domain-containing protein [Streptomyces brevispora]|uniref:helix-turn-helix domain-containing protein n=1 Tax=Streptomyces brevispora TaxID=887462 RepID=UPI0035DB0BA8